MVRKYLRNANNNDIDLIDSNDDDIIIYENFEGTECIHIHTNCG